MSSGAITLSSVRSASTCRRARASWSHPLPCCSSSRHTKVDERASAETSDLETSSTRAASSPRRKRALRYAPTPQRYIISSARICSPSIVGTIHRDGVKKRFETVITNASRIGASPIDHVSSTGISVACGFDERYCTDTVAISVVMNVSAIAHHTAAVTRWRVRAAMSCMEPYMRQPPSSTRSCSVARPLARAESRALKSRCTSSAVSSWREREEDRGGQGRKRTKRSEARGKGPVALALSERIVILP